MKLEMNFCDKHIKIVTKKSPICIDCLKEKGFDVIEQNEKTYINAISFLESIELHRKFCQLEEDYQWSLSMLNSIATLAKVLENTEEKELEDEIETKINQRVSKALQNVGASINIFIMSEIAEKENRKINGK